MARISRSDIKRLFLSDAERLKKKSVEARTRFEAEETAKQGESPMNEIINRIVSAGAGFATGGVAGAVGSQFAPTSKKLQPLESAVGGGATGFGIKSATGGETDPLKALSTLGKAENIGKTAGVLQTVSGKPVEGLQTIGEEVTAEKKVEKTLTEKTDKETKKDTLLEEKLGREEKKRVQDLRVKAIAKFDSIKKELTLDVRDAKFKGKARKALTKHNNNRSKFLRDFINEVETGVIKGEENTDPLGIL